jgi:hypothetical protein
MCEWQQETFQATTVIWQIFVIFVGLKACRFGCAAAPKTHRNELTRRIHVAGWAERFAAGPQITNVWINTAA